MDDYERGYRLIYCGTCGYEIAILGHEEDIAMPCDVCGDFTEVDTGDAYPRSAITLCDNCLKWYIHTHSKACELCGYTENDN